jgi:hypothetical protein
MTKINAQYMTDDTLFMARVKQVTAPTPDLAPWEYGISIPWEAEHLS